MIEYTIFCRHGNGKPFSIGSYKSIDSAKSQLNNMLSLEIERGRPFYVDNDFFENKYDRGSNLYYLSILEREVSEWKQYTESCNISTEKNKIIYFYSFK